jgi:hypothetical protein
VSRRTATWNQENCVETPVPRGTKLTVEVRAADVQIELVSVPYTEVHRVNEGGVNEVGAWLDGIQGRYLQIRVRFVGSCPGTEFATPVLCDLRAHDLRGDCNCDGLVNNLDITPFVKAITGTPGYPEYYALYPNCNVLSADVNCDGVANDFDLTPYVECLTAGGCGCQ